MTPPAIALVLLAAGGALAGCAPALSSAVVCGAPASCAAGSACVAGHCAPERALPVPARGVRVLLPARDMVVLAASDRPSGDALAVGAQAGELVVLLRFSVSYRSDATVERAFLVLEPVEGAPPARASTTLEVARILEPWDPTTASWGRRPRLTVPELRAIARPGKAARVRVDVTELVRRWAKHASDDHGLALFASSSGSPAAHYASGLAHGRGPTLEVYLR